jgi:hypothetical protein
VLDQQRVQMVWPVFRVDYDNERTSWGNRDEVQMRHDVPFTAGGVNFVRHEWNTAIESADGLYDHEDFTTLPTKLFKIA